MDSPVSPDSLPKEYNLLLVALREAASQFEAAGREVEAISIAQTLKEMVLFCTRQADQLESEIRKLGFLPKAVDPDRVTFQKWITRLEGTLEAGQPFLVHKIQSISAYVQENIKTAQETNPPAPLAKLLQKTAQRFENFQDFLNEGS